MEAPFRFVSISLTWLESSNGKTLIVYKRTLSFFAFRNLKKRKFAFFHDFKFKIIIEPVRLASILSGFKIKQFASLRFASLRFANLIFGNNYVRFASLNSQFNV